MLKLRFTFQRLYDKSQKKFIFQIGTMDPLSDAFVLLLVENVHRNLSTEVVRSTQGSALVRLMSPKLIRLRLSLEKEFVDGLCDLSTPEETVNQLAAIAVLKKLSVEGLLNMFLESKMVSLFCFSFEAIIRIL